MPATVHLTIRCDASDHHGACRAATGAEAVVNGDGKISNPELQAGWRRAWRDDERVYYCPLHRAHKER